MLIPHSVYVPGMINTDFYYQVPKQDVRPLHMVYSAHQGTRKNFPYMAQAFNQLDSNFYLHIIGDWQDYLHLLTNKNYTFYGSLDPEAIRRIYQQSHIFISCSTQDFSAIDGFPTTAAADAMATGCVLVSTNPRLDRYVLVNGIDYIQIDESKSLESILMWIHNHFDETLVVGAHGTNKIKAHYDAKLVVSTKLRAMGLI